MSRIIKDALILMLITLVAGVCLGMVHDITKAPIAASEKKAQEEAYQAVFSNMSSMQPLYDGDADCTKVKNDAQKVLDEQGYSSCRIEEAFRAVDEKGNVLGVVMNITTAEGYGGDINFSMGIHQDGTLSGVEILTMNETAGLGMRAADDEFKGQFTGKPAKCLTLTKSGSAGESEIDALSGATITSSAVTNGVNAGIAYYDSLVKGGVLNE